MSVGKRGPDKPVFRSTATVRYHCQADTPISDSAKTRLTPSPLRSSPCLLQPPAPHSPGSKMLKEPSQARWGKQVILCFFLLSSVKSIERCPRWTDQSRSKARWTDRLWLPRHFPKLSTAVHLQAFGQNFDLKPLLLTLFWHFLGQAVISLPLSSRVRKAFCCTKGEESKIWNRSPRQGTRCGIYELSSWLLTWEARDYVNSPSLVLFIC